MTTTRMRSIRSRAILSFLVTLRCLLHHVCMPAVAPSYLPERRVISYELTWGVCDTCHIDCSRRVNLARSVYYRCIICQGAHVSINEIPNFLCSMTTPCSRLLSSILNTIEVLVVDINLLRLSESTTVHSLAARLL